MIEIEARRRKPFLSLSGDEKPKTCISVRIDDDRDTRDVLRSDGMKIQRQRWGKKLFQCERNRKPKKASYQKCMRRPRQSARVIFSNLYEYVIKGAVP